MASPPDDAEHFIEYSDVQIAVEPASPDYGIDPEAEPRLRRKLDWRIIPIVTICYLFLFLDTPSRTLNNRSAGLVKDLGLGTYDFNIGTTLFYIAYIACEVPFALLIKRVGFQLVPLSIIAFGVVSTASAFIHNKTGFYVTRIFLGISESSLAIACLPSCKLNYRGDSYLLTRYYRRHEVTRRIGIFMPLSAGYAGGFGGLVSAGLLSVRNIGSRQSWQNVFLVEGILTIACGIVMLVIFPADPERTRMLTAEERRLAIARLHADQPLITVTKERTDWPLVKRGILSPVTLVCGRLFIVGALSAQGLGIFLPSILEVNYPDASTVRIQLLVIPIYIAAMAVATACAVGCTKYRVHWPFLLFSGALTLTGYSIWVAAPESAHRARYAACFLNLAGGFASGPIAVGWAASNASPDTLRAMAGAVVTGLGNLGGVAGVWAYVATDAATGYHRGNSFNVAMSASLCACSVGLALYQRFENAKRKRGERDYRLGRGGVDKLGNLHPYFRYIY
ncbi:major facilitator superfamily domain-containing protein [Schizophyllum fasciatum]